MKTKVGVFTGSAANTKGPTDASAKWIEDMEHKRFKVKKVETTALHSGNHGYFVLTVVVER